jgi:heterodisulfide reductase subunit C
MTELPINTHEEPLRFDQADRHLVEEVTKRSGTQPGSCLMCLSCSGGCPFYASMDYGPHGIMRRIHLGLREEVLTSRTIWFCVGCHTCSTACPMAIDISAVMDALRQMSLEEGKASQPGIVDFHREVLRSIERHGRTHKLEIMMRHKVRTGHWFQDMDLGLRMLAKRKLDLMPSKVRHPEELKKLFLKPWRR